MMLLLLYIWGHIFDTFSGGKRSLGESRSMEAWLPGPFGVLDFEILHQVFHVLLGDQLLQFQNADPVESSQYFIATLQQGLIQALRQQNKHVLDGLNGEQLMVHFHPIAITSIIFTFDAVVIVNFIHELQTYFPDFVHVTQIELLLVVLHVQPRDQQAAVF